MYRVVKRDGITVDFDVNKISTAITKAFNAVERKYHPTVINMLALQVTADFDSKIKNGLITVEEIQDSVEKVLSDCGYADGQTQLRRSVGPLYPLLRLVHRAVARYDLNDSDVRPSLRRARLPILFVHGREDHTVPFSNAEELYGLYRGPKDCLFVDGAKHVECIYVAPDAYEEKLKEWIASWFSEA